MQRKWIHFHTVFYVFHPEICEKDLFGFDEILPFKNSIIELYFSVGRGKCPSFYFFMGEEIIGIKTHNSVISYATGSAKFLYGRNNHSVESHTPIIRFPFSKNLFKYVGNSISECEAKSIKNWHTVHASFVNYNGPEIPCLRIIGKCININIAVGSGNTKVCKL